MKKLVNKAQRWVKLERYLLKSPRGVKVTELSKILNVHRSTIYRDIDQLSQEMGLPLWLEDGLVGTLIDNFLAPLKLNIYEALSLFIALRLLLRHSGERNTHIESLLEKLADILPPPVSDHLFTSAQIVKNRPEDSNYLRNLETLMFAWVNKRRVRMWYQSAWKTEVKERLFDVYFIEPLETVYSCFVIGLDHWYGEVRTFKIKRIKKIEITKENYNIINGFNIFQRWANSWGIVMNPDSIPIIVKVRFSKNVAFMVKEAIWHHSQKIENTDDGGCIFSAAVDNTLGIKLWLRTWGPDVEILEPEELRIEFGRDSIKIKELYSDVTFTETNNQDNRYAL